MVEMGIGGGGLLFLRSYAFESSQLKPADARGKFALPFYGSCGHLRNFCNKYHKQLNEGGTIFRCPENS